MENGVGGPSELEQFLRERVGERAARIEELLASGAALLAQSREVMAQLDSALRPNGR